VRRGHAPVKSGPNQRPWSEHVGWAIDVKHRVGRRVFGSGARPGNRETGTQPIVRDFSVLIVFDQPYWLSGVFGQIVQL
jgi:hypothetical protein